MTMPAAAPVDQPGPNTPVLLNRKINPAADPAELSVFQDDRWNLHPGRFEGHARVDRLNFTVVPDRFRDTAKHAVWQMINHDQPVQLRDTREGQIALSTFPLVVPRLIAFLIWLDAQNINSPADITAADLDHYLSDIVATEASPGVKSALLVAVRRLWAYRSLLPAAMRLPAPPPWNGDRPADLLTQTPASRENRTPRIATDTIEALLMWCLRFVDQLADDIIAAHEEYLHLQKRSAPVRRRNPTYGRPRSLGQMEPVLTAYLDRLGKQGTDLPGRLSQDGVTEPHWAHLTRLLDGPQKMFVKDPRLRQLLEQTALPVSVGDWMETRPTGHIAGRPWRATPISYTEAPQLAQFLRTACLVLISYLTGMRTGEVLNLERDCVQHDPVTDLWSITGRRWKSAYDQDGNKLPEGEQRQDPWTTIEPAARAIDVLHRLHPHPMLFPRYLHPQPSLSVRTSRRPGQARDTQAVRGDIDALITWINQYCAAVGLPDQIPADPHGRIAPSRLRRTLAWHIVRRPRGLIAGAIQYGHLHVRITLGYAGTYDSGFPDERAYEDWLHRLDTLVDDHQRLAAGERISGPAADEYHHRIQAGHHQFAGRVLTNTKHARDLITNPLLQIYPGRAMTCVFDPAKALCQLRNDTTDTRRTPDQDDCRPNCQNIAYTDRDIADLRARLGELRELTGDHLSPSPRWHRERAERDRLVAILRDHDHEK